MTSRTIKEEKLTVRETEIVLQKKEITQWGLQSHLVLVFEDKNQLYVNTKTKEMIKNMNWSPKLPTSKRQTIKYGISWGIC